MRILICYAIKKDIMKPTDYIEWDNLKYTL